MTTRTLTAIAMGTVCLSLTGCSGPGKGGGYTPKPEEKVVPITIAEGQEADLFPAKVGNTWVYEDDSSQATAQGQRSAKTEVTFKITGVVDTADGKEVTVNVLADGKLSDRMKWRIGSNGIYELSGTLRETAASPLKDVKFEPPVPVLPFPTKDRTQIDVAATGVRPAAGVGPFKSKVTVDGIQEVDTAMGRFSALSSTSVSTYQNKGIKCQTSSTAYWAPKVGIVRYVQDIVLTNADGKTISSNSVLRLKSHQP